MTENDPEYVALRDYVVNEAKYAQAKEAYASARTAVLALLPKEVGEFSKQIGEFTLTIKYPEKIVWDAEQLDALYGSDKPAYVKMSYSIDLRQLRRLPESERKQLEQCYEIKPGTPDIDVAK